MHRCRGSSPVIVIVNACDGLMSNDDSRIVLAQTKGFGNNWDNIIDDMDLEYPKEPTLDAFRGRHLQWKGGNKSDSLDLSNPCSKVNYSKVAKRRAKNKQARKIKHKR